MTVCANYIEGGSATSSNMAVMEIYLPSGFTVDRDSLYALRRYKGIKRVDPERGDTKVKSKTSFNKFQVNGLVLVYSSEIG